VNTRGIVAAAVLAAAALTTSVASAASWSAPAIVPGGSDSGDQVVFTPSGHGALMNGGLLAAVSGSGHVSAVKKLDLSLARLATYGADRLVVVGTKGAPGTNLFQLAPPVEIATGTPESGVGALKAIPGTSGQSALAVAGNAAGLVAIVTGKEQGHRDVWLFRDGTMRRVLTFSYHFGGGIPTVAVGPKGDVLVAYGDGQGVDSRHIGPTGRIAAPRRLGPGVEPRLVARYDDSGRQEVAWISQQFAEGEALTPATIRYASAAAGHGFSGSKVIGRSPITVDKGVPDGISGPGVGLVGSGSDSSVLALTVYDGHNYRVEVADVAGGVVPTPQVVSPAGQDDVLNDLAYARAGGTVVLWTTNTRGINPNGPQSLAASTRATGQAAFAAPQIVSGSEAPFAASAAVDPATGAAVAAFGFSSGGSAVSALATLR
jgi:hypothetical protein